MGLRLWLVYQARDNSLTVQTTPSVGSVDQAAPRLVAESKRRLFMEPVSTAIKIPLRIKNTYLEPAQLRIPNPELLVNVVRLRVRQLVQGHRPLTQTNALMEFSDIALKEISEGKLGYEFPDEAEFVPTTSAVIVASPLSSDTLAA
jgi:DNA-directed RNA polymerase subunit omega